MQAATTRQKITTQSKCRLLISINNAIPSVTILSVIRSGLMRDAAVPIKAGVLDDVDGAYAAYSVRKLKSGYGGPALKVKRASDGSTQEIGFDASGNLDVSALNSFCSGADCFVTVWYDQSGGGADLSQSDTELQPQIVQTGKISTDSQGLVRLSFNKSVLSAGGTPLSNQNLTAFFVQQSVHDAQSTLIGIGYKIYNTLQYWVREERGGGYIGDGSTWTGLGDFKSSLNAWVRSIQILDAGGQTLRFYRNSTLIDTKTHSKGESVQSVFQIGSYTGDISEVILYRALSDLDRAAVYNNINSYFLAGPTATNSELVFAASSSGAVTSASSSEPLLPQDWQYQVDLYNWLATLKESDFITSPKIFIWDETYADVESLSNLWLSFYGKISNAWPKHTRIIRSEPRWFVLNDGNGAGIEGSGTVKIFRPASTAGFFYSLDLPLAGKGQGNPYYRSRGVGMRALVSIAVDMMMHDRLQDESPQYWSNVDFAGGAMLGWVLAYRQTRDLISPSVQKAFEQGFAHMAWKMLQWGAHDVNGNMDSKAVAALAHAYVILSDPTEKQRCLQAAKKILFGSTTGTPETTDYKAGLYRRAGYIDEGDSPETTYNGVSLF